MDDRHQPGRLGQLCDQLRRNQRTGSDKGTRRIPGAVHGGLLGDHMNHHRRGRRTTPRRAIRAPAATTQPVRPRRQRPQGIGTALFTGAGIVLTDRGRQRIQRGVHRPRIGGEQAALDLRQTPFNKVPEGDLAFGLPLLAAAHRISIGLGHDLVDLGRQPAHGQRRPPQHLRHQLRIHLRQHLPVGDQPGAIHHRLKQPDINITGLEQLCHLRQPLPHRPGIVQPTSR